MRVSLPQGGSADGPVLGLCLVGADELRGRRAGQSAAIGQQTRQALSALEDGSGGSCARRAFSLVGQTGDGAAGGGGGGEGRGGGKRGGKDAQSVPDRGRAPQGGWRVCGLRLFDTDFRQSSVSLAALLFARTFLRPGGCAPVRPKHVWPRLGDGWPGPSVQILSAPSRSFVGRCYVGGADRERQAERPGLRGRRRANSLGSGAIIIAAAG